LSALFTLLVTNKKTKAIVLTVNKQNWLDDFRATLVEYLSATDMTAGMSLAYLNVDPKIDKATAVKLYPGQLIRLTLAQEKLLLFL
jgi:hypothetical protein